MYTLLKNKYSLVLKESHVSLFPHMNLIKPSIDNGWSHYSLLDPAFLQVWKLFRIIPKLRRWLKKFWDYFAYWKHPVRSHVQTIYFSLGSIHLPNSKSWLFFSPTTQLQCTTVTLISHIPLIQHQRFNDI